jgi:hypothetical protein
MTAPEGWTTIYAAPSGWDFRLAAKRLLEFGKATGQTRLEMEFRGSIIAGFPFRETEEDMFTRWVHQGH